MPRTALHWFRRDLRLADNPALATALARAEGIATLFVLPETGAPHTPGTPGTASRAWLGASLAALDAGLRARGGSGLAIREGAPARTVAAAAAECDAETVTCSRDWTPAGLAEEREVAGALAEAGIALAVGDGALLVTPDALVSASGRAFRVFTPFWHAWRRAWPADAEPLTAPSRVPAAARPLGAGVAGAGGDALALAALAAPPRSRLDLHAYWTPGEAGAQARLAEFARDSLAGYSATHDLPAVNGTSELSPHLAWGEISPRQVAYAVAAQPEAEPFLRQLAWGEFAYHVLHDSPSSLDDPLRPEFSAMAWRDDPEAIDAWQLGQTGFPLVDAGMRQLAETGWMHNRVRMVAASLLAKDLLVRWQEGERVFAETLVDFDPALNAFNWQWVAGSGADAAPYFRVFNPTLQAARFDAEAVYIKRWVPELSALPARWAHAPAAAPVGALAQAGGVLGKTYPRPIVDHAEARLRALAAFSAVKAARGATSAG